MFASFCLFERLIYRMQPLPPLLSWNMKCLWMTKVIFNILPTSLLHLLTNELHPCQMVHICLGSSFWLNKLALKYRQCQVSLSSWGSRDNFEEENHCLGGRGAACGRWVPLSGCLGMSRLVVQEHQDSWQAGGYSVLHSLQKLRVGSDCEQCTWLACCWLFNPEESGSVFHETFYFAKKTAKV